MADTTAHLQEQFETVQQQREAGRLGMWLFLATEVLFFGGLFLGYTVYRTKYPAAFVLGSHHLDVVLGTINTAVLLLSSFTMALAVHAAMTSRRRRQAVFLMATIVLGCAFLGIKGYEYTHKYHEHLVPGVRFDLKGEHASQVELFFGFYFAMTGLHATHMVIGIGLLAMLMVMAWRGRFDANYYAPVEITGLYWHFVDIVWIFLYPLLYLIGRHG